MQAVQGHVEMLKGQCTLFCVEPFSAGGEGGQLQGRAQQMEQGWGFKGVLPAGRGAKGAVHTGLCGMITCWGERAQGRAGVFVPRGGDNVSGDRQQSAGETSPPD